MKKTVRLIAAALSLLMLSGCTAGKTNKDPGEGKLPSVVTSATESETESITEATSSETLSSSSETTEVKVTTEATEAPTETTKVILTDPASEEYYTEEGKKSLSMYGSFLADEIKIDVSPLKELLKDAVLIDFVVDDLTSDTLTASELAAFIWAHAWSKTPSDRFVEYGYADCGLDGDPELIYKIDGIGDGRLDVVIKHFGDDLRIVYTFESWNRCSVFIRQSGVVEVGGADGATSYVTMQGFFDGDGQYYEKMTITTSYYYFEVLDPALKALDVYREKKEPDLQMHVIKIEIPRMEPVYVIGADEEGVELSDGILQVMDDTNLPTVSEEEMNRMIDELFGEELLKANGVEFIRK